ncbi:MAG: hypothetical protein PF693_09105 [Spirochaetia bacterium]|jgi:hypothetical protein|nr:hypothetical protein [Spirochaetia bacterium]
MKKIKLFLVITLILSVFISCATTGGSTPSSGGIAGKADGDPGPVLSASPVYYATGSGSSQSSSFNDAKMNAVQKAASDALGIAASLANRDKLESKIYIPSTANAYVYNETMEILDRGEESGNTTVSIGIRINLEALSNALRANEIYGNIILPQGGDVLLSDMERPAFAPEPVVTVAKTIEEKPAAESTSSSASAEATPEEIALIDEIISKLSFMVYYDEESAADPFLVKTAVGMANRYLSENGMEYVDLGQIEQIKKDQAAAYEDETGQGVSMIQWIAGKLNADIYIEIVVDANSNTKNNRYYGSASVSLKNFDASTAAGRGSSYYQTVPPAMSTVSEGDALNNAVASATFNAIQKAVDQARAYTQKELTQGIKYDLVVQNTYDSRLMRDFMKKMERKVKSIKRISTSPEETKYEVRLIGQIEDLEDLVYDVSEGLPGLEGMSLVYQRGNSITFDSGL